MCYVCYITDDLQVYVYVLIKKSQSQDKNSVILLDKVPRVARLIETDGRVLRTNYTWDYCSEVRLLYRGGAIVQR